MCCSTCSRAADVLILLVLLPNNIKTLQKTNNFTVTQKTVRLWFMSCMGVGFFFILFLFAEKKSWPTVNYTNSKLYHLLEERIKISLNIVWGVESRSMFMYLKNGVLKQSKICLSLYKTRLTLMPTRPIKILRTSLGAGLALVVDALLFNNTRAL